MRMPHGSRSPNCPTPQPTPYNIPLVGPPLQSSLAPKTVLVTNFPTQQDHAARYLAVGPDNKLYVGVGELQGSQTTREWLVRCLCWRGCGCMVLHDHLGAAC